MKTEKKCKLDQLHQRQDLQQQDYHHLLSEPEKQLEHDEAWMLALDI